ncbi:hypothetical protein B484DRAFT_394388, partial [Ochromonadaceae sp. CCMP2298]
MEGASDEEDDEDADGEGDEEGEGDGDGDAVSLGSSDAPAPSLSNLIRSLKESQLATFDPNMHHRSLLRAGVFSAQAIEQALAQYGPEFLLPGSSRNVGMRMKAELQVRRALRLDADICPPDANELWQLTQAEAEADGEEGSAADSDSDPSVDCTSSTKMLKCLSKSKNPISLVAALRKQTVRRKKMELEGQRRIRAKQQELVARQEEEARRATEAAQSQAQAQAREEASSAAAVASRFPRVLTRRKMSIFQSLPKHAPMYRLAPEESRGSQPLQVRLVNFKEFEERSVGGSVGGGVVV